MNNNELMKYLSIVRKNHSQRNQIMFFGVIAIIGFTGCCVIYSKYRLTNRSLNELKSENHMNRAELTINKTQILKLNNTIAQLISEKGIKTDNHDPSISPNAGEINKSL